MWKIKRAYAVVKDCGETVSDRVEAIFLDKKVAEDFAKELTTFCQEFWVEELPLWAPEDEEAEKIKRIKEYCKKCIEQIDEVIEDLEMNSQRAYKNYLDERN